MTKKEKKFDLKITRESLNDKEFKDIQKEMEQDVAEYSAKLATLSIKELDEQESLLMDIFKENDARMEKVSYSLSEDGATYDGITVKPTDIEKAIVNFLNRLEVDWKSTLGIHQGIRFWKTRQAGDQIPYGVFDSTLRLLGTLKYKGEQDCFNILVINNWVSTAHDEYLKDTGFLQYLAALHQAIMTARGKLDNPNGATQEA